ncbi:MAG TPA: Ig-like domain-containing protein [Gemmatimonadales bacterium]|nr:Ig-like domain-containing protein [Gemmatimonadales bacterium]
MATIHYRRLRPLAAALAAAAIACGGDLTLPDSSGAGLDLSKVRGDGQTGAVGEALADPVVVRVLTEGGQPVAGRKVAFLLPEGESGAVDPDTAVTNGSGEALSHWVLGPETGEHALDARIVTEAADGPTTRFLASAVAGPPDTLRAVSPLFQPGRRGQTLTDPLVVAVVDRFGNPVAGFEVAWEVTAGDGELSATRTPTDGSGEASVIWTLGGGIGVQKVSASVTGAAGSPVTFSATVLF